jgi:hypothetical protein
MSGLVRALRTLTAILERDFRQEGFRLSASRRRIQRAAKTMATSSSSHSSHEDREAGRGLYPAARHWRGAGTPTLNPTSKLVRPAVRIT